MTPIFGRLEVSQYNNVVVSVYRSTRLTRSAVMLYPTEPVKQMETEPEEEEEVERSPEPPSSDEEDTVHVTIGKVKAHPHRPGTMQTRNMTLSDCDQPPNLILICGQS